MALAEASPDRQSLMDIAVHVGCRIPERHSGIGVEAERPSLKPWRKARRQKMPTTRGSWHLVHT
jgi:hypothetical protein